MERLSHGELLVDSTAAPPAPPGDGSAAPCPPTTQFGYLFPTLQKDPSNRLPDRDLKQRPMAVALIKLGNSMMDTGVPALDSPGPGIPSVYSYFGQFITHEVVFEITTKDTKLGPDTVPLDETEIPKLENARTTLMDLDSVYGPMLDNHRQCFEVPKEGERMALGKAGSGDEKYRGFDLKREFDPPFAALIGDRRNDSNLIISQMHLAFLRAHNALIDQGHTLADAQKLLRQHFQWLVLAEYLPHVVDEQVLDSVRNGSIDMFNWTCNRSFMPVEFSAAAFRFAHSMPRNIYNFNQLHSDADLFNLFLPIPQYTRLIPDWIIDWARFLPGGQNVARRIDTRMVQPLFHLIDADGKPVLLGLAALDLLRGYLLGLPTGQAVARLLGVPEIPSGDIENVAGRFVPDDCVAACQKTILAESGLSSNTPLWFYILAEAALEKDGSRLGQVGSRIVAGVLIELLSRSNNSILQDPTWKGPTLGNGGFNLKELFKLAGVLPPIN
jgi:Animal haem peroxidase